MRIVEFDNPEQWHKWRAGGLGASDIASAATGTYGGAYSVVARKLGQLPEEEENDRMRRGHAWEHTIADTVHVMTGLYVVGEQVGVEHEDDRWRYTGDGFLAAGPTVETFDQLRGVYECKTTGVGVRHNWERTRLQVQWALMVSGLPIGLIVVATIDDIDDRCLGVRLEYVEADELVQRDLVELAEDMWAHMQNGTVPEPDGSDDATELVRARTWVAEPERETVDLAGIADVVDRRQELKPFVEESTKELARLNNIIKEAVGQAKWGSTGRWDVTYSDPQRVFDADAALEAHPEFGVTVFDRKRFEAEQGKKALDEFRSPTGARTLTVRKPKEA